MPAQSAQVELSPSHTPHPSTTAVELHKLSHPLNTETPPQTSAQSGTQSLAVSLSQVPQLSIKAVPLGLPAQSVQVVPSPPETPQISSGSVEQLKNKIKMIDNNFFIFVLN